MDPARWERVQEIFHAAADLPADGRAAFVASRCAGDAALAREVNAMLAEDGAAGSPLDAGLAGVAQRLLAGGEGGIPEAFGPYRLLGRLGEGGSGVVFLAERADLRSRVAIKILRDAWLSPARRERFAAEQRTLAQLNHPAIARLYDADTLPDGTPWFAMEVVEGLPITEFCARGDHSLRRVLGLFRVVCEAVRHAHQHAVIHCDLKPSNVLVTSEGLVKLLDFGIARQLADPLAGADPTVTGWRMLTPAYAAPEQVRGGRLTVATDLYALGVMLYELLTGRLPFDVTDRSPLELERVLAEREPERPSLAARRPLDAGRRTRGIPTASRSEWADLDVLCLTALQKEPARRYASVESLIRDLDHFLRGEPLEARPDTAGYRAGKFVRRHWRPLAATAAAAGVVVALTAFYTVRLEHARDTAMAEARRTRRIQAFMTSLFDGGEEESGPADTLRVRTLLAHGERQARALDNDPLVRGELYQTLGDVYERLGDFGRADTLLGAALAERRGRLGRSHPDVVRSLVALALLRADQSELDVADSLAREAIALAKRVRPPDPALLARATTALGVVQENRGTYPEAIATLTDAVRLGTEAALPPSERSGALTSLANCRFYAGDYPASDSLNRIALALDRATWGERDPHVASDLVNLGAIAQETGRYAAAESLYHEALGMYRDWYGPDHYEVASVLTMIGRTRLQSGDGAAAAAPLEEALAIRERVYGPAHPSVASTLNELGTLALQSGAYDRAEADYRRVAAIYESVYHGRHYLVGVALSNLGSVRLARGDAAGAERLYRRALALYAQVLPADHLYVGIARLKLGRSLLRQRRLREAERQTSAGRELIARHADAGVSWLEAADKDLAEIRAGLGEATAPPPAAATAAR